MSDVRDKKKGLAGGSVQSASAPGGERGGAPGRFGRYALALAVLVGGAFTYVSLTDVPGEAAQAGPTPAPPPSAAPTPVVSSTPAMAEEWTPQPFTLPVQYAYAPDLHNCRRGASPQDVSESIACNGWTLRVKHTNGEKPDEQGLAHSRTCSQRGCWSNIRLHDAVNFAKIDESTTRSMPLQISPDGHSVVYFSASRMQFVGWHLPTARIEPVSPRMDVATLAEFQGVDISPDGRFFSVSFSGESPRVLVTNAATRKTSTFRGFCDVLGISRNATVIAAGRGCRDAAGSSPVKKGTVAILDRRGKIQGEWRRDGIDYSLSPDGLRLVEVRSDVDESGKEQLVIYNTKTAGRVLKKHELRLLSQPKTASATGRSWANEHEYVVRADKAGGRGSLGYYAVDVRSGASQRLRDLPLRGGEQFSLGKVGTES
ncbi:hypothetical protein [Sinosporangium siamense]|uniref:WD40 repeat protein n=1 Tax=Sinosporangium siamense TaxID=1367973 RepID=A0A919RNE2_9ACTN|nr:hypothetical protein [Sinosporangium siamense]GII95184.1 hypothetical protein Ssi02_54150 [Sinosporangium siamense]